MRTFFDAIDHIDHMEPATFYLALIALLAIGLYAFEVFRHTRQLIRMTAEDLEAIEKAYSSGYRDGKAGAPPMIALEPEPLIPEAFRRAIR